MHRIIGLLFLVLVGIMLFGGKGCSGSGSDQGRDEIALAQELTRLQQDNQSLRELNTQALAELRAQRRAQAGRTRKSDPDFLCKARLQRSSCCAAARWQSCVHLPSVVDGDCFSG